MIAHRTRLAPSPTGALHLGNARTFLVNWAMARQRGWEIVLRIEDLDGPRIKKGAAAQIVDLLEWLGLDWDEGPHLQCDDLTPYEDAMRRLAEAGQIYPCRCTRKEIEQGSLSAPHGDQHELRYPGTCRLDTPVPTEPGLLGSEGVAWRLYVPPGATPFVDEFCGHQAFDVHKTVGDFLVGTKLGLPSYQLAVVVDDARQRIDQVVRGDDLLSSTPRQLLLYDRLGLGTPPTFTHLPLVLGQDGRRLAKRHGDTRLCQYRRQGVTPQRVLGLLAEWCGVGTRCEMTAQDFLRQFDFQRLARSAVVFGAADDMWLRQR